MEKILAPFIYRFTHFNKSAEIFDINEMNLSHITNDPQALMQEQKRSIEMMLSIRLEGCSSIGHVSVPFFVSSYQ